LLEGVAVGVGELDGVFFSSGCACFQALRLTRDLHCGHALVDDGEERQFYQSSEPMIDSVEADETVSLAWISDLTQEAQHELLRHGLGHQVLVWAKDDSRRRVAFKSWASVFASSFLEGGLKLALTQGQRHRLPTSLRRQLERDLDLSDKWLRGWPREFEGHLKPVLANLMTWSRPQKHFRFEEASDIQPQQPRRRIRGRIERDGHSEG
jgi:hypothetical protein